jgi:(S)-2-hydroxyglutarate dehydrogenase
VAQIDVAVVGAGIVGLATARALSRGSRVVVVEKEPAVARHQSGHNSGVVHAGVYYAPGSLKARLCVEGKAALERYAAERGIELRHCGKLVVARDAPELPRLAELKRRATANGVPGLVELGADGIREVEPHAAGLRALHSPRTAIVDFARVAEALADDVRAAGGEVVLGRRVTRVAGRRGAVELETDDGTIVARTAVTCAGLQADRLARGDGLPRIVPFRGDYYTLAPHARALVRGLIYPVPDPAFPFLGIHFTPTVHGEVLAGPNAVLALAREGYRRAALDPRDALDALTYPGLWRFGLRHWRVGAQEAWRDASKRAFVREMQRYVPAVRPEDVAPGPAGIRAQALGRDGRLVDDFVFERGDRVLHVLNAPSPAATSALAIGELIAAEVAAARS